MPISERLKLSLITRIVLLGALPLAILVGLGTFYVIQSREQTLAQAHQDALQLVRTLETGVSATLQSAEIASDVIIASARSVNERNSGAMGEIPQGFVRMAQDWPFIQTLGFINAEGRMTQSLLRSKEGQLQRNYLFHDIDFSVRPTFTTHRTADPKSDQIYISEMKPGIASNSPIIIMTKGAWSTAGQFLGVSTVAIRKSALEDIFRNATPVTDGAVTLFRSDGLLLFATPGTTLEVGGIYDDSRLIRTAVYEASEGAYRALTAEDGKERIFAYRVSPRYSFVVVVAVPMRSVMAEWRQSTMVLILACLLSAVVIVALLMSLIRRYRLNRGTQEALRESESRLKDMVECSSDFQWETDANGIVRWFVGQGSDLFPDIIGRNVSEIFVASSEPHDVAELIQRRAARLPVRNLTVPALGRDGNVRWVRNSANPIFDASGVFRGYRGIGADVTEVRQQRKIIEAKRKDEALGRLTSGLAHEINNLLQPILIYSDASAVANKSDATSSFSRIRRAAESASEIVKNVLSFARESPPRKENVNLAQAVRDTLDVIAVRIPDGITVTLDLPDQPLFVWVDRTGFAQALTNLLNNSVEAIATRPHARGTIVISASIIFADDKRLGLRAGQYGVLRVEDDGPGIPHESFEKVFDPFFTTKSQAEGTGLGLSVVAGLAKSWGGAVDVQSVPAQKTVFSIYLQLAELQLQAAQ
ncbi:MAG: PAS domain S-box protein [Rhodospirillaceae bacterium]|nr:PAS domain S-box protein [Rhodospirillaceae bacterium]